MLENCRLKTLEGFPQLPNLVHLSLANNRLETCRGFPVCTNLRFLSLENNNLDSFEGMSFCPNLESIVLSGNSVEFSAEVTLAATGSIALTTLNGNQVTDAEIKAAFGRSPLFGVALRKGLPISSLNEKRQFPEYEGVGVDEMTLRANAFLTEELREDLCKDEEMAKYTFLPIDEYGGKVMLMIKAKSRKWYVNRQPSRRQTDEWELVKGATKQSLDLTQMMYQHLIKCEFTVPESSKVYSLYSLTVVGAVQNELILPFPVNPKVVGNPVEGSLISLIPMPLPVHVFWYVKDQEIAANVSSIRLDGSHVGQEISCVLQPYCPKLPHIVFTQLLTKTEPVADLAPIVSGVVFPDDVVEGIEIRFNHHVFPRREGDSEIYVERAFSASGNWERVAQLQKFSLNYTPRREDLNYYLRISYLPILDDGRTTRGRRPCYFYSKSRVLPGTPTFTNPMIAGETQVGHPVVAIAEYSGGKKGDCAFVWYASRKPLTAKRSIESQKGVKKLSCTSAILKLKKDMEGMYLGVEMLPVRDDDMIGEKVFAVTTYPIEAGDRLDDLPNLPKTVSAFTNINVGMSVFWYRTNVDWKNAEGVNTGFEKMTVGPEYTPVQGDVGRYLRLTNKDGSIDVIIGEVEPSVPFIYSFALIYDTATVGSTVTVPMEVFGRTEKTRGEFDRVTDDEFGPMLKTEVVWIRVGNGSERVVDIDTHTYTFTNDDIGSKIKAVVYPLDENDNRCEPTESEMTQTVKARKVKAPEIKGQLKQGEVLTLECASPIWSVTWQVAKNKHWHNVLSYKFDYVDDEGQIWYKRDTDDDLFLDTPFTLEKEHVDCFVQAEIVIGEWDGRTIVPVTSAKPVTVSSRLSRVEPGDLTFSLPPEFEDAPITEGQTIRIQFEGRGAQGRTIPSLVWEELDEEEDKWIQRGSGIVYTFKPENVGHYFRVRCTKTDETIELGEILSVGPSASEVTLFQDIEGSIAISTEYVGGTEGKSRYFISYVSQEDKSTLETVEIKHLVATENCQKFTPWKELFGKRIDVACIPVRDDGVAGKCRWSTTGLIVKPVPLVRQAAFEPPSLDGVEVGTVVKCTVLRSSLADKFTFKWQKVPLSGESDDDDGKTKKYRGDGDTYTITENDDNCMLICQIKATAKNGFLSPVYVMKIPVRLRQDVERTLYIEIPDRGTPNIKSPKRLMSPTKKGGVVTGDILKPVLVPDDHEDVTYTWQWQNDEQDDDDMIGWTSVAHGPEYHTTIADVGKYIRCVAATEFDEVISAPIGPIAVNPIIVSTANAVIRSNSLKFKAKAPVGPGQWEICFGDIVTVKSRNGKEQKVKWADARCEPVKGAMNELEFVSGPASRFVLVPSTTDKRLLEVIPGEQMGDFIAYIFSEFQRRAKK